jgi:hypothetical protein
LVLKLGKSGNNGPKLDGERVNFFPGADNEIYDIDGGRYDLNKLSRAPVESGSETSLTYRYYTKFGLQAGSYCVFSIPTAYQEPDVINLGGANITEFTELAGTYLEFDSKKWVLFAPADGATDIWPGGSIEPAI